MFPKLIQKGLKLGLKASTGRKLVAFLGQATAGSLLFGLGFGFLSRSKETLDEISGRIPRAQIRADVPPPPDQGGPEHMHANVSLKDTGEGGRS